MSDWADPAGDVREFVDRLANEPPTRERYAVTVIHSSLTNSHAPAEIQSEADEIARRHGFRGARVFVTTRSGYGATPLALMYPPPWKRNKHRFVR